MKVYIVKYSTFNQGQHHMEGYGFDNEHSIIADNEGQAWCHFLNWLSKFNIPAFPSTVKFNIQEITALPEPTSEPQTV